MCWPGRLQQARKIDRSRFAFDRGIGGQNNFLCIPPGNAVEQTLDLELFRSNAAQRRNRSVEHMIDAWEGARGFKGQNVVGFFHYANLGAIAVVITAIRTQLRIADVVALGANAQIVFDVQERGREARRVIPRGAQHMEC